MKKIEAKDLAEMLCPPEGEIWMVAGEPGAGKGYLIAMMMLDDLRAGIPVYSTMPLIWEGENEIYNKVQLLFSLIFPWRNVFVNIKRENFHYIPFKEVDVGKLKEIYGGHLYIDEGQFLLPSGFAERDDDRKELTSMTRHMYRRIVIVSQRFNAVNVNARGLVHRYFQCDKVLTWPIVIFRVSEYRKLKGGEVDEEHPAHRPSLKFGRRRIFKAYKSHYWGEGKEAQLNADGFVLTYFERLGALWTALRRSGGAAVSAGKEVRSEVPTVP